MPNKLLLKATPLITAALLLTILATPVFAVGGHLWFYSVDPATLPGGYPPLVNPQPNDPNWTGTNPDPWLEESVVVPNGDWESPYSIWLGNADPQDNCYDTMLVISVNDTAAAAIFNITVNGSPIGAWDTIATNFPLAPHGVANSAEWYGFVLVNVGDILSGKYIEITIDIDLNTDLTEPKIHYDACGWSTAEHGTDPKTADITSPFSHDYTFIIPEAATILAVASSLAALGTYAYKRKKQ